MASSTVVALATVAPPMDRPVLSSVAAVRGAPARRALVLEDDPVVRALALDHLNGASADMDAVAWPGDAAALVRRHTPDLVVLGGVQGAESDLSCRLRQAFHAPVVPLFRPSVFVRPRLDASDRGPALMLGLSDCRVRISQHLQARTRPSEMVVRWGEFTVRLEAGAFAFRGQDLGLTRVQGALLSLLMLHGGEVVSKRLIEDAVFHDKPRSQTNFISVHISRIRAKLRDTRGDIFIENVRGGGYALFWNRSFCASDLPRPEVHGVRGDRSLAAMG